MNIKKINFKSIVAAPWRGGNTYQYYISPQNELYDNRNFLFRISCATIELDQSNFTQFEGYTRYLLMLDNKLNVVLNNKEMVLKQNELLTFDSNDEVISFSQGTDFNLMVSKDAKEHQVMVEAGKFNFKDSFIIVFCLTKATVVINNKNNDITRYDALVIENPKNEELNLSVDTKCIIATIN